MKYAVILDETQVEVVSEALARLAPQLNTGGGYHVALTDLTSEYTFLAKEAR